MNPDWQHTIKQVRIAVLHSRWSLIVLSLCLFIWLFGTAVLLPHLLRHVLQQVWPQQMHKQVTVGDIRFHPWHWALTISDFRITETDGSTLAGFQQLIIDYDMISLFRLEYGIDAVEWRRPYARLEVSENGTLTIQALAGQGEQASEQQSTAEIPAVWVKRIDILDAEIDYVNAQREKPLAKHLDPVSFSLLDFHTRKPAHQNHLALTAKDEADGTLTWEGQVQLAPLRINGQLALKNISLLPALDWVMPVRQFTLQDARLDLDVPHQIQMTEQLALNIHDARLGLHNIRVAADPVSAPVISMPVVNMEGISLELLSQQVNIGQISLSDGVLALEQDAQGQLNLQSLFAMPEATAPMPAPAQATPAPASQPWQVGIGSVQVQNYRLDFLDRAIPSAVPITLFPIQLQANHLKPLLPEPMDLAISVGLPQSASIELQGKSVLNPFSLDGQLQLKQLPLTLVQPYVARQARVELKQGALNAALSLKTSLQPALQAELAGTASVNDLDVHELSTQRKLVSWQALELAGIDFSLAANRLAVDQITVRKPYGRFIINKDGTTNIQQLLIAPSAASASSAEVSSSGSEKSIQPALADQQPPEKAPPFALAVRHVAVDDGDLGFADMTLKPNFRVAIERLGGSIDQISTDPAVMTKVDLKGKVDRYAPVTIKGTCNVLGEKPALDMAMSFKNIELTTFTPYSGTYAGFVIDKGQLSLDLDYKLVNNRIAGKNHIVMNQLQLGEHVENEKAIDLPIRLAIALLRDERGVIDLGFEVEGNVDEPSFSIGGLVLKVLGNIIRKAVTAPFTLLSGMVGAPEQTDQIAFAPGSTVLDQTGEQKVAAVAAMLQKRSMLAVNVRGYVVQVDDRLALQQQKLAAQLEKSTGEPAANFLSAQLAVEGGKPRRIVSRQYQTLRNEDLNDIEERLREEMLVRQEKPDRMALKTQAYQQAWQRLAEQVVVTDVELRQLALGRASQVKAVLMENHGIAPGRIFVLDAESLQAEEKPVPGVLLGLEAH